MSVTDGSLTTDYAQQSVRVIGTVTSVPSGTQTVSGTVTANQGTAAATAGAWPIKISNGTSTADLAPASASPLGNALLVTTGQLTSTTSLSAATGNTTGTVMDSGAAHRYCSVVAVGTSTLTGNVNLMGSMDNTTFVQLATVALTAAGTVTVTSPAGAFRYFRADFSGSAGSGTVTAKIMAS